MLSRSSRTSVAALLAACATALVGTVVTVPPAQAAATEDSDITMVQANIKSALSTTDFRSDVAKVLSGRPDFVTYNEVPVRTDPVLAPEGYDVYRLPRNRYTKETAVAWRTDRWTAVDTGTFRVSNYRKRPPGRHVKIGLRFANWATLQSTDGRQLSVVAVHLAPYDKNMPSLLGHSVKRLRQLAERLAPLGPVLFGGDFNVHYRSHLYPRRLLDAAGMVPTYDTLGTYFPTGDHRGATIDYVFNRGEDQLEAVAHSRFELKSDHDAVVANLNWTVDAPSDTQRLVSNPQDDRRLAVKTMARTIRRVPADGHVAVVTRDLTLVAVNRQLRRAVKRGVHVTFLTRSADRTRAERRLARLVRRSGTAQSSVESCRDDCLARWRDTGLGATFVLVSDAAGDPELRVDASRPLDLNMLRRRTRVSLERGDVALRDGRDQLASLS